MPNETPLECPDCEGHGKLALYNPETQDYGPTVTCDACEGSGERRCEASPQRCDDAAVGEHVLRNADGHVHDRFAFCAMHLREARAWDYADEDPPDEDRRPSVRDTLRCPAPDFGATG